MIKALRPRNCEQEQKRLRGNLAKTKVRSSLAHYIYWIATPSSSRWARDDGYTLTKLLLMIGKYLRSTTFLIISLLFLGLPVTSQAARVINITHGNPLDSHIEAVGAVVTVSGKKVSLGTGTYIGDKKVITAAHLFQLLLPKSAPKKTGPIVLDLSEQEVYWTTQPTLDRTTTLDVKYKASKIIVDACFINEFAGNSEAPDIDDIKCDIAILVLETSPDIKGVQLSQDLTVIPTQGSHVGYGEDHIPGHHKRSRGQTIQGIYPLHDWGVVISNIPKELLEAQAYMQDDPEVLKKLLAKSSLSRKELENSKATQGDSGGPLLVVMPDNTIRIIGILSAHSTTFNAFASLLSPTQAGYIKNPNLEALLRAAR